MRRSFGECGHIGGGDKMVRREEILCLRTTQPCRWQMRYGKTASRRNRCC
nr:MAG TPA: hypothetical protein [Caudoviricetes sp.]